MALQPPLGIPATMMLSMSLETLLAFTLAMFLLAASPGPGFLMVVARALTGGMKAGLATIAGLVLGDLLFLVLAILGLSALAAVMGEFFLAVKILGAAYLIWLGVKTWRSRADLPRMEAAGQEAATSRVPLHRSAALGFFVTLGNPKVIIFYGALLPTFVDVAALTVPDVAALSAVVTLVLFTVLTFYAYLAARAGRMLKSPRALTWLNRVTGGLLIGAGVAVATR
ncbi:LysE family translocator [Pelagibius sp. CAU 1746]|uniref:LysE family translocator n=1 Tax=Pelagibius sp. CAU 1746 TaxID=3140370 RepID=UPI00325B2299